jgi:hypothetical protein
VSCRDRVPCLIPSSGCVIRSFGPQLRPARLRRSIASPCQDREQVRRAISSRVNHQGDSFGSAPSRGGHLDGWFHNAPNMEATTVYCWSVQSPNAVLFPLRTTTGPPLIAIASSDSTVSWQHGRKCSSSRAKMHQHQCIGIDCRPGNPHPLWVVSPPANRQVIASRMVQVASGPSKASTSSPTKRSSGC